MSKITITEFVLKKVKIEANQSKNIFPSLKYMQRLNKASRKIAGKRNFQEVKSSHNRYLENIYYSNDLKQYECSYCHFHFCPDLDEDRADHEKHHREWEKAECYLNYSPLSMKDREELKKDGYDKISPYGEKYHDRFNGALSLMKAYFDKSLESAIFGVYWERHPSFEDYISITNHQKIFPQDVSEMLDKKYGRKEKLSKELMYWFPA